jgi:PAS domain S-box-containing protein
MLVYQWNILFSQHTTSFLHWSARNIVLSLAAVAVAVFLRWSMSSFMELHAPFAVFFAAIMIGAWVGGAPSALVALATSLLAYCSLFAGPLYAAGGTIPTLATYTFVGLCITFLGEAMHRERRKAESKAAELRRSEERSARAQEAAHAGVWEGDLVNNTCYFSPEFRRLHGIDDGEYTVEEAFNLIHPDDREQEKTYFRRLIGRKRKDYARRSRFIHPVLGERWQLSKAELEYDENGDPVRITGTSMDVTDLHVIEERSSRAQSVAQAGTWEFDLLDRKAYLSPEYCRLMQCPQRSFFTIEEVLGFTHPDDVPVVHDHFNAVLTNGSSVYVTEHRHLLPDGQVKWRLSRGQVQYGDDGTPLTMVGATIDVSDRKAAEIALQRSEERFRLAAEALNGMIYDQDMRTREVFRSEGLHELVGVRPAEVPHLESWWLSLIHPEDLPLVTAEVEAVKKAHLPLFDLEYRVKHAAGHWVWISDKGRLSYGSQGELVRIVGCTTDINVRKRAEMELQEADRRKDEFIATLAHELRNPLSPLQHAIDLLDVVASDAQALQEMRTMMERQMKHLVRLVDDLLDVSRISRGKIELRRSSIDLVERVNAAVEANKFMIQNMRQQLHLDLPVAGSCVVDGDPERLTQVISNLLHNASKFTPAEGHISITLSRTNDHAEFKVQDNGIGLGPDATDRIFEMFVQSEQTTARSHGGLGIGLNLVRRLVIMHGGSVKAESAGEGKGSTFTIVLPLMHVTSTPAPRSLDRATAGS